MYHLSGASSALFIQSFTETVIKNVQRKSGGENINVITAEHIRQCLAETGKDFDFVQDIFDSGFVLCHLL